MKRRRRIKNWQYAIGNPKNYAVIMAILFYWDK